MKRSRFTEEQIILVLREHEAGAKTANLVATNDRLRNPDIAPRYYPGLSSLLAFGLPCRGV